jgi:hypothetical protein
MTEGRGRHRRGWAVRRRPPAPHSRRPQARLSLVSKYPAVRARAPRLIDGSLVVNSPADHRAFQEFTQIVHG